MHKRKAENRKQKAENRKLKAESGKGSSVLYSVVSAFFSLFAFPAFSACWGAEWRVEIEPDFA